jgi:hypothetical protein
MARLHEVSTRLVTTGEAMSLLQVIVDAAIAITSVWGHVAPNAPPVSASRAAWGRSENVFATAHDPPADGLVIQRQRACVGLCGRV